MQSQTDIHEYISHSESEVSPNMSHLAICSTRTSLWWVFAYACSRCGRKPVASGGTWRCTVQPKGPCVNTLFALERSHAVSRWTRRWGYLWVWHYTRLALACEELLSTGQDDSVTLLSFPLFPPFSFPSIFPFFFSVQNFHPSSHIIKVPLIGKVSKPHI